VRASPCYFFYARVCSSSSSRRAPLRARAPSLLLALWSSSSPWMRAGCQFFSLLPAALGVQSSSSCTLDRVPRVPKCLLSRAPCLPLRSELLLCALLCPCRASLSSSVACARAARRLLLAPAARVELFYCAREVLCSPRRVELPRRVSLFRTGCRPRADS
jgi:hypothetical protein